jgi:hypothetical protein
MKKIGLFAIILIMVVSLVPLGGVSAQRAAPASSASMSAASAPAARLTYYKQIKTQLVMYTSSKAFKYVQKIYWGYDYSTVRYWSYITKGVVWQTANCNFLGSNVYSQSGGVGYTYFYLMTQGIFWWKPTEDYYYINIEQEVRKDGTWWKDKSWFT